jgi:hypothetical protein
VQRAGEAAIAREAALLKDHALARIAELERELARPDERESVTPSAR